MTVAEPAKVSRVLLVEDHSMFREQLVKIVNAEPGFSVCGEAADASEGLRLIKDLQPDLVVVDIGLRDSDGISLIEALRSAGMVVPVLVLSMHEEVHFAERAIKAGARGYVSKQESARQVILGMHEVQAGRMFLSPRVSARRPKIDYSASPAPVGILGQWVVHVGHCLELDSDALRLFSVEQAPWSRKPLQILAFNNNALDLMIHKGAEEDWLPEDWPPVQLKITVERIS